MTYQVLKMVHNWCMIQRANMLIETDKPTVSKQYLEALAELAAATKRVMKFL